MAWSQVEDGAADFEQVGLDVLLLWVRVRLNCQVILLLLDQLLQVVVSRVSVLEGWGSEDFRVQQEQVLEHVKEGEGVPGVDGVIDDVVEFVEELLHVVRVRDLSHNLLLLFLDLVNV